MANGKQRHRGVMRGGDEGQSLVETAVMFPLLIVLLAAGAEFARAAFAAIEVSSAAKAAVQYGAQNHSTVQDSTGMQTAAANDAADLTGLTATPSTSLICSDGTAVSSTDCPGAHVEVILTVTTSATYNPLIHWPGLPTTFALSGQAVQKVLQ
jgi:Flp pilus assembly protein TadG